MTKVTIELTRGDAEYLAMMLKGMQGLIKIASEAEARGKSPAEPDPVAHAEAIKKLKDLERTVRKAVKQHTG
jgi:hypothetical protein